MVLNLLILMVYRLELGMVEVHDKEIDMIYVFEGLVTIVMGGTMVGGSVIGLG